MNLIKRISHSNVSSIAFWYFPSIVALIYVLTYANYNPNWWYLTLILYFMISCLGITVTYHRYLAHKSFTMPKFLERLFTLFACMGGTGSSIGWVAVHKNHHRYSDKKGDPHSPDNQGFSLFYANYEFELNKFTVRELLADKFHKFVHEYYNLILFTWSVICLLISPAFFLFGFMIPIFMTVTISNLSNYINHYPAKWLGSYRLFEVNDKSVNNPLIALLSWGEGWHNNHHAKPWLSSFQQKWWEIDISGLVIKLIGKPIRE